MPKLTAIRKQALDEIMKEALFEATVSVLGGHGVGGLTMERVASEAGIAKGSLYRYFRGKRDLLEFVFAKLVDPIFQDMEKILVGNLPAIEKLNEQLRGFLEHVAKHERVHKLLYDDETAHGLLRPSERSTIEAAARQLAVIFQQGIEEGDFRPGDPLMLANLYLGLCMGVLHTQPNLEGREQRENIYRLILDTFLNGIAVEEGRVGRMASRLPADGAGMPARSSGFGYMERHNV